MATISFSKDFAITKKETVDRLEKGVRNIKPLTIESKNAVADMRRREEKFIKYTSLQSLIESRDINGKSSLGWKDLWSFR